MKTARKRRNRFMRANGTQSWRLQWGCSIQYCGRANRARPMSKDYPSMMFMGIWP
jgi:hypothetical protein